MPIAWRALGSKKYDAVISSHHAFAHTNRLADGGTHLSYVYSPARYVWSPDIDERGTGRHLALARAMLKHADRRASRRVDAYAAISTEVASRIQEFWGRDATVIHPPVRVEYFGAQDGNPPTRGYVLGIGRWIPYKNLHLVVEAASIAGLPVKIAGRGPDKSRILEAARSARVPVDVVESPTDDELRELYRNAAVLVFPTVEDFGIVPVEAQAAGTPVVAPAQGGALDTVIDGESGILTESLAVTDLAAAIKSAIGLDPVNCQRSAGRFSEEVFRSKIRRWTTELGIDP